MSVTGSARTAAPTPTPNTPPATRTPDTPTPPRRWSVALYGALVAFNLAVAILLWPVVADALLRAAIGRLALPGLAAVDSLVLSE